MRRVPDAEEVSYPALRRAVMQALARHSRIGDPVARAVALGELLGALHDEVLAVTAERDAALTEVLGLQDRPSNRALAAMLGISGQRVDRLSAIVRRGGRERRR